MREQRRKYPEPHPVSSLIAVLVPIVRLPHGFATWLPRDKSNDSHPQRSVTARASLPDAHPPVSIDMHRVADCGTRPPMTPGALQAGEHTEARRDTPAMGLLPDSDWAGRAARSTARSAAPAAT